MEIGRTAEFAIVGTRYGDLTLEETALAGRGVALRRVDHGGGDLARQLAGVDVVLLGSQARLSGEVIAALPDLRGIVRYGIGVDNVDLAAAKARGLPVAYVPDYCVEEVATHTVTLLLACLRRLGTASEWVREGGWGIARLRPLRRLSKLTVGLLGCGRIGRAVAERLRPFGSAIVVHDPYVDQDALRGEGLEPVTKEELLARADAVSLHLPLSERTRHILGAGEFRRMRDGVVVVNTARGGLVDQRALLEALASGKVAAAGLDVLEEEPPDPEDPLLTRADVIVTPHAAWYTEEAEVELRQKGLAEALRILAGEPPLHPVW